MCSFVCGYVYVCVCACVFVFVCACVFAQMFICVGAFVCHCAYLGMCIFMCVCMCACLYVHCTCRPVCVSVSASVFARVSVTLMFSGDLQWTFELELRADFPRDDPAPYNPLCVTDLFLLQYCHALYESLFFFPLWQCSKNYGKRSSESYTSKFVLLHTFSLLLVMIKPRKWKSVVDCVRLCPVGSCFLVIYAPRVNHCSKRRQETLSNCKSICIWLFLYVRLGFFGIVSFCRRYRLSYESSNLNSSKSWLRCCKVIS